MTRRDPKGRIINIAALLLPLVLVKGTALVLGNGPGATEAAPGGHKTHVQAVALQPNLPKWTEGQLAAARYIEHLRTQPFGPSPLLHGTRPVPQNVGPEVPVVVEPKEPAPPSVDLRLTMLTQGGNIALIDRKRYREGDPIGEHGWIVKKIDVRSVIIEYPPTGRTHEILVPPPR